MQLTRARATLQLAAEPRSTLAECPVWDAARGVLWWVDILGGTVHGLDPRTAVARSIAVGAAVGCLVLRPDGTLLVALADRLAVLDPESGTLETLVAFSAAGPDLRCNDGACDPAGRLWVDRMAPDAASGAGALLCVDAGLSPTTRMVGLTIPNGLDWSLDGRTMYFVDSTWGEVRAHPFDAAAGTMGDGIPFVRVPEDEGVPDGITVDAEGCVWVALFGGGSLLRVAPDGSQLGRLDLPVSQVSSCAFGGSDLGDLYITTAHEDFGSADLAREPLAGRLFRCRPGVRGRLPVPFGSAR